MVVIKINFLVEFSIRMIAISCLLIVMEREQERSLYYHIVFVERVPFGIG